MEKIAYLIAMPAMLYLLFNGLHLGFKECLGRPAPIAMAAPANGRGKQRLGSFRCIRDRDCRTPILEPNGIN